MEKANAEGRILITADTDFGELVVKTRLRCAGVILCRLSGMSNAEKATRVLEVLKQEGDLLLNHFVVISLNKIRGRSLTEERQ